MPHINLGGSALIRYMGTKRQIAYRVRRIIGDMQPDGPVVNLFSGAGSVARNLAGLRPVVTNDSLAFTGLLARARFTGGERVITTAEASHMLRYSYERQVTLLVREFPRQLREEERALTSRSSIAEYMTGAQHVANNADVARLARKASSATGPGRYRLATLYFAAGYFSLLQAIELDPLRFAIDQSRIAEPERDWLLGAWLAAAATVVNAPGHTAQHLMPNTDEGYKRIHRYWSRSIWSEFEARLDSLRPIGPDAWRAQNRVETMDAVELLRSGRVNDVGAVYADPRYTRDQYSRYYHVYETLYRYDYPDARGKGRVRSDRFSTDFCRKRSVVSAFQALFDAVAELGVPLVLSYPSAGLLAGAGSSVAAVADGRMSIDSVETFPAQPSLMPPSNRNSKS